MGHLRDLSSGVRGLSYYGELEEVCMKWLEKRPEDRYASLEELAERLAALDRDGGTEARYASSDRLVGRDDRPGAFERFTGRLADFGARLRGLLGRKRMPALDAGPTSVGDPSGGSSYAEGSNDFACAIYQQLRERSGNLFLSPFGVRAALAMAHAGARGETAAQMERVLHISASDDSPESVIRRAIRRLHASSGGEFELSVATSLWGQEGAPLRPEYLDRIAQEYGGSLKLVDFRRAAEAARAAINEWVEDATRQKIREIIAPGSLSAETRLVLANAIYFKGVWEQPFRRAATLREPFHLEGGGTVPADLMARQSRVRYVRAARYQAVELVYRGGDLSMIVLLPDRKDGLPDLEREFSARMFQECVSRMDIREVKIFLPRFQLTWARAMDDELTALGMTHAFSRSLADFSGINGRRAPEEDSLFLSILAHKAFVEVHEEGTTAAAATAVLAALASAPVPSKPPPIPVFRADHPFFFAICDRRWDAILFLGRVADPSREG